MAVAEWAAMQQSQSFSLATDNIAKLLTLVVRPVGWTGLFSELERLLQNASPMSPVGVECPVHRADVAPAKEHDVHEQGVELEQPNSLRSCRCEWRHLLICGKHTFREAAEEAHHRQVDLAVAAIDRRVHEHGRPG